MPSRGKFDPETMTDAQREFWIGMTDQRVANMWDAADFIFDLSPDAKEWLRKADKEKIENLDYTLRFMNAATIVRKFLIIVGAIIFGSAVTVSTTWEWIAKYFVVKVK